LGARSRANTSARFEQGIEERALENGVLAGYPVVGREGRAHRRQLPPDVDSSEMAFKIAGSMAFKEAATRPGSMLLERSSEVEGRHARRVSR